MSGRRRNFECDIGRRLIGLALLVALCASMVPLPVARIAFPEKDQSQPFPCQNRPCGCTSAEQCWRQCCCFTNAQKVAWARENGVTPPDYVVKAACTELHVKVAEADAPPRKARCSGCCHGRNRQEHKQESNDTVDYVIGFEAMKCRGQGLFWNSLPWAVIPVVHIPEHACDPGRWGRPQSAVVVSIAAEPPEPPPRLA